MQKLNVIAESVAFAFFCGTLETYRWRGYICGYVVSALWVYSILDTQMALTDTEIKKAKPQDKPYKLSDGAGLYIWITPSGGRKWRASYRNGGKQKTATFGGYPEVSLALARERHRDARKLLAEGLDPMERRKAIKSALGAAHVNSFASVAALWFEHWQEGKSARHVDSVRRRMAADILPAFGTRPIASIEAPEVVALTKAIEQRGAHDIAKRSLETTGQVFRYAVAHGYAKRNPAVEIKPSDILRSVRKINHARIDAKELPELLKKIEVYHGTHVTRLAIKLLALTFVRTSELIQAKWSEFDFEASRWDIPVERMKMRTPHVIPLAKQTLEALDSLRPLSGGSEWLFPGDRDRSKPMSNNTILKGLERMGYKGKMTGHGFRGLASTVLHEQGYNHDHIELQLAHAPRNAVSAAYNHALYLEPRAKMMQDWADFLERTQRGAKVLPFSSKIA
jgi:integrase